MGGGGSRTASPGPALASVMWPSQWHLLHESKNVPRIFKVSWGEKQILPYLRWGLTSDLNQCQYCIYECFLPFPPQNTFYFYSSFRRSGFLLESLRARGFQPLIQRLKAFLLEKGQANRWCFYLLTTIPICIMSTF